MNIDTFISVLRSRLDDLSLTDEYIDDMCNVVKAYLDSLSDEERSQKICEEYLEELLQSAISLSDDADIRPSPMQDSNVKSDISSADDFIKSIPQMPMHGMFDSSQTVTPTLSNTVNVNTASARSVFSNPNSATRVSEAKTVNAGSFEQTVNRSDFRKKEKVQKFNTAKESTVNATIPEQKRRYKDHSSTTGYYKNNQKVYITEKDLYNNRSESLFISLLLLFSPTILIMAVLVLLFYIITIVFIGIAIVAVVAVFGIVSLTMTAFTVLSLSFSVVSLISGNAQIFISELGAGLVLLPLTVFASMLLLKFARYILSKLASFIIHFSKNISKEIKDFIADCKKGCATL